VAGAEKFEQLRQIAYFCGPSAFHVPHPLPALPHFPSFFFAFGWATLIAFSLQFVSVVLVVVDCEVFLCFSATCALASAAFPRHFPAQWQRIRRRKHIVSN